MDRMRPFARRHAACRPLPSLLLLAVIAALARPAAPEGLPADLAGMARRAGVVAAGEIVQVRPGTHPRYPRLGVTFVTLRVSESFKGTRSGMLTFMQIGHAGDARPPANGARYMRIPDLPQYRPGEEVLLFLYPATETGLTSPVDGHRGKLALRRDARSGATRVVGGPLSPTAKETTLSYAAARARPRAAATRDGGGR